MIPTHKSLLEYLECCFI